MKIKCNICGKDYTSTVAMKRHFNSNHKELNNLDNVKYEYTDDEIKEFPYECDICGFRSNRIESISRHKNGSHLNVIQTVKHVKCVYCNETVISNTITRHVSTHNLSKLDSFVVQHSSINPAEIPNYLLEYYYTKCFKLDNIYTTQIKSFIDSLKDIKYLTIEDIDNFFENVLPFKLQNPKIGNSKELANLIGLTDEERTLVYKKMLDVNPFVGHGSELSPFSKDFLGYKNLSKDEVETKIDEVKQYDRDDRSPSQYKYWINKGYSEDDAKLKVHQIQKTFSLDICIRKYGEVEGTKRWKTRQKLWIESISTPENQQKIHDGRVQGGIKSMMVNGLTQYSKISQELFHYINNGLNNKYSKVYFATLGNPDKNNEIYIKLKNGKGAFLDFYIEDINKAIEFDGDYWHGDAITNKKRDNDRERLIKESIDGIQILRIRERDYKNDKSGVVKKCIDWLSE